MLAQIAVAICVDLGIPRLIAGESNNQLKAELERTYIAVYYMSSWYDPRAARLRKNLSSDWF